MFWFWIRFPLTVPGSGHATCLRFNRKGDYLASGRVRSFCAPSPFPMYTDTELQADGTVVIFDIETNGVARKLRGHTRQIQSLRYYIRI